MAIDTRIDDVAPPCHLLLPAAHARRRAPLANASLLQSLVHGTIVNHYDYYYYYYCYMVMDMIVLVC
jgi:hypothetical protein